MTAKQNIRAALIGNPNSGKSTLFNVLTGLKQKVGNFPGVTVDKLSGQVKLTDGKSLTITDLPGTYSLNPRSMDEEVVRNVIIDPNDAQHPDLILLVIDASSLRRSLFLATQVLDTGIPALGILNMGDIATAKEVEINVDALSERLGIEICPINALKDRNFEPLKDALVRATDSLADYTHEPIAFIESSHPVVSEELKTKFVGYSPFSIYNMLINPEANEFLSDDQRELLQSCRSTLSDSTSKLQLEEIGNRYKKIKEIVSLSVKESSEITSHSRTDKIDKILTHRVWGTLAFLFIFFLLFQSVFSLAVYPMNWIDSGMGWLNGWARDVIPEGMINDFVTGGILSGIGGVVIFIPQIAILFGLITILEDTGYMARVSFINDGILKKVGMNGKSIVPLVGGFACAVPAIMAARSIESKKERLITIMVTPLMSCSARLPVYVFLIAFIVPDEKLWGFLNLQGLFMLGLYLLGVVMSAIVALIISQFVKSDGRQSFYLELPTYKTPRLKNVLNSMINKSRTFVVEAGKVILIVSMVLWFLASFGPGNGMDEAEARYDNEEYASYTQDELGFLKQSARMEASYAGYLGKLIEPAIKPLGFDWKIGIALVTSFAAREVFVGTMSTIYGLGENLENIEALQQKLLHEKNPETGLPIMGFATALSLIMFYVFAMQCMSTVAITRKETGNWKWPVVMFVYMTAIAYLASLVTYQLIV